MLLESESVSHLGGVGDSDSECITLADKTQGLCMAVTWSHALN